jgi:hypothetical protein
MKSPIAARTTEFVAVVLVAGCSLASASAVAAETRAVEVTPAKEKPAVLVLLPQQGADRADLEAIGERLRELSAGVALVKSEAETLPEAIAEARAAVQRSGAVAVLWVDEWRGERTLFVHVKSSGRTLARRLPRGENPVVAREELASVARGTVSALLDGHAPSMDEVVEADATKADAPEAPPAAAPSARPERADRTVPEPSRAAADPVRDEPPSSSGAATDRAVSASARAGYFGASPLVDSGTVLQSGASLGLRVWFPYELFADASYAVVPADTVTIGGTRASIARHPATFAAGKAFAFGAVPALWLSAELTFGMDRVTRETLSPGVDTQATATAGRWVLSTGARAGVAYVVAPRVNLYALLGAELVTTSFRYVSESPAVADEQRVASLLTKLDVGGLFDLSDAARFYD